MKTIALLWISAGCLLGTTARADLSLETESARFIAPGQVSVSTAAEYQLAKDGDEYALPLAIEIGVLPRLELLIEPVILVGISPETGKKIHGVGDTELTVNYLLFEERDQLPAIALGLEWKAPTARKLDIGTKKSDFAFYVIASKRFGDFDVNANLTYTVLGEPTNVSVKNTWAVSASGEYHLSAMWDLYGEATYTSSARGGSGSGAEASPDRFALPVSTRSGLESGSGTATAEVGSSETIGTIGARAHLLSHLDVFGSVSYDNAKATLLRAGFTWRF